MARKRTITKKKDSGTIKNIFSLLYYSTSGKIFLFIFFWSLLLSINILVTENVMDKFLFLTGIEILAFTVVVWIYFLFRNKK